MDDAPTPTNPPSVDYEANNRKGYISLALFFILLSFFFFFLSFTHNDFSISSPISLPSQCTIVSTSVDLKSSKVCELGLLNYKAKNVFYPLERSRFRCRYDYYWASVFKVPIANVRGEGQMESSSYCALQDYSYVIGVMKQNTHFELKLSPFTYRVELVCEGSRIASFEDPVNKIKKKNIWIEREFVISRGRLVLF